MYILLFSMALVLVPFIILKNRKAKPKGEPIKPTGYHLAAKPEQRKGFNNWAANFPSPRYN
jgi:hypothetical protein